MAAGKVLGTRTLELPTTPKRAARTCELEVRAVSVTLRPPNHRPVETAAQAEAVVDYYTSRWAIETFFRTLKSGCRVEEIRLETKARQKRCLVLYHIIAWRIEWLTRLGRLAPETPVNKVFTTAEWKSVCV